MIFITLGSQKFQFNRLLKKIDELIDKKVVTDEVFAQIGYSDYSPRNYKCEQFLDREEFAKMQENSDTVITHGGTGAIINAVKKGKKVVAIARNCEFGEHVDNHQRQIVEQFVQTGMILGAFDVEELEQLINKLPNFQPKKYVSSRDLILNDIGEYIKGL
jgi:UDP-N-acetylglucosamine transferase subunit ALG13